MNNINLPSKKYSLNYVNNKHIISLFKIIFNILIYLIFISLGVAILYSAKNIGSLSHSIFIAIFIISTIRIIFIIRSNITNFNINLQSKKNKKLTFFNDRIQIASKNIFYKDINYIHIDYKLKKCVIYSKLRKINLQNIEGNFNDFIIDLYKYAEVNNKIKIYSNQLKAPFITFKNIKIVTSDPQKSTKTTINTINIIAVVLIFIINDYNAYIIVYFAYLINVLLRNKTFSYNPPNSKGIISFSNNYFIYDGKIIYFSSIESHNLELPKKIILNLKNGDNLEIEENNYIIYLSNKKIFSSNSFQFFKDELTKKLNKKISPFASLKDV